MKRSYVIMTSISEDSPQVATDVTVDFDGYTFDHAIERFFTSTSPRVALQQKLKKIRGGIPATWECKATEFGTGRTTAPPRPMTLTEMFDALDKGKLSVSEEARLLELAVKIGK